MGKNLFEKNIESLIELPVEKNNPMEDKVVVARGCFNLFLNEDRFKNFFKKNILKI